MKLFGCKDLRGSAPAICYTCFLTLCVSHAPLCPVRRCSPLFPPDNGYMKCDSDKDNYGATCEFTCTGGYELAGSAARVCQYGLTWSGIDTTCTRT